MTPYERHKALGHKETRHSHNGINVTVECLDGCGLMWQLPFKGQRDQVPVTIYPVIRANNLEDMTCYE